MARITQRHRVLIDRKIERIKQREGRVIPTRRRTIKKVSKVEFHSIIDKASQPIENPKSDSE